MSRDQIDYPLIIATLALVAFGLLSIFSSTFETEMHSDFSRQLSWSIIGIIAMITLAFASDKFLSFIAYPLYALSVLSLLAVLVAGVTVYGSKSWLPLIGGLRFQPAELAKLATVLAVAKYLAPTERSLVSIRDLFTAVLIVAIPCVLVLVQPDFGTALVFVAALLLMALWCGADLLLLFAIVTPPIVALSSFFGVWAVIGTLLAIAVTLAFFANGKFLAMGVLTINIAAGFATPVFVSHLAPYQQKRIETFLDPTLDPLGAGYNVLQAKLAVGSGGIFGKGFLQGTQTQLRYIPKQWTDFIYCVTTEEFGFLGAMVVLGAFAVLITRGVTIASQVHSRFASAASVGISAILLYHVLVNIGMTLGILPVMGIPLPFMSYGGTALFTDMMMVGMLLSFYRHRRDY